MAWQVLLLVLFVATTAGAQSSPMPDVNSDSDVSDYSKPSDSDDSSDDSTLDDVLQGLQAGDVIAISETAENSDTTNPQELQEQANNYDATAMSLFRTLTASNDGSDSSSSSSSSSSSDSSDSEGQEFSFRPAFRLNPSEFVRRQGELINSPSTPEGLYLPTVDQSNSQDSSSDSAPLLQLIQGGYQHPFQPADRFIDTELKPTSNRALLQPDTQESRIKADDTGRQQNSPRINYAAPFPPAFNYGSSPNQPYASHIGYMPFASESLPNIGQNHFFGMPPMFSEVPSNSFQPSFSPFGRTGADPRFFQSPSRNVPSDASVLFQNPRPYARPQQFVAPSSYPMFAPESHQSYSGFDSARPDYSSLYRSPAVVNNPFNPNFYSLTPNDDGNVFNNVATNFMPGYPNSMSTLPPQDYPRYPTQGSQTSFMPKDQDTQKTDDDEIKTEQKTEQVDADADQKDLSSIPFGTRLPKPMDENNQNEFLAKNDVYLRYPLIEAGYATEENLPDQNTTDQNLSKADSVQRPVIPFYPRPHPYPVFTSPDPYQKALNAVWERLKDKNEDIVDDTNTTERSEAMHSQHPRRYFAAYPEAQQGFPQLFIPQAIDARSPFQNYPIFPGNTYPRPDSTNLEDSMKVPQCAQNTNLTICFDDPEYPRRELRYALNADSFLLDRMSTPDQDLEAVTPMDQNATDTRDVLDNYICKADVKKGLPLRAQNVRGNWKVIVNADRVIGNGRFMQPVRLEICSDVGGPCSFTTQVKTICAQKYSIHRLLSWSPEKGVHNDVYRLPVACSCQVLESEVQ